MSREEFATTLKAELKQWRRLSFEQQSLLRAFCVCLAERIDGRDPEMLLPRLACELIEGGE